MRSSSNKKRSTEDKGVPQRGQRLDFDEDDDDLDDGPEGSQDDDDWQDAQDAQMAVGLVRAGGVVVLPAKDNLRSTLAKKNKVRKVVATSGTSDLHARSAITKLCLVTDVATGRKGNVVTQTMFPVLRSKMRVMTVAEGQRFPDQALVYTLTELIVANPHATALPLQLMVLDGTAFPEDVAKTMMDELEKPSDAPPFGVSGGGHYFSAILAAIEAKPYLANRSLLETFTAQVSVTYIYIHFHQHILFSFQLCSDGCLVPAEIVCISPLFFQVFAMGRLNQLWTLMEAELGPGKTSKHGTMWDLLTDPTQSKIRRENPWLQDLSEEELIWAPTAEIALTILVREHNDVPSLHTDVSTLQELVYMRRHLTAANVSPGEDIPFEQAQKIMKFCGINDISNVRKRVQIALASDDNFEKLLEYYEAFGK